MSTFADRISYREFMALSPEQCCDLVFRSKVLVVRADGDDLEAFRRLMARLGEPVHHVLEEFCVPGRREVLMISNLYRNGRPVGVHEGGAYWHTDMSYLRRNTVFTALLASRVPSSGGGTEFIDCAAAWERLCDGSLPAPRGVDPLKIAQFRVRHRFGNRARRRSAAENEQRLSEAQQSALADCVYHPLVLKHPRHGSASLYAAAATSVGIEGLSETESLEILDALFDALVEYAPRYEHRYERGDIVLWDNLSTLHRGPDIPGTEDATDCRLLFRINVDYSRTVLSAPAQLAASPQDTP